MLAPYEGLEVRAHGTKIVLEPEAAPERLLTIVQDSPDVFRVGRVVSMGDEAARKCPDLHEGDRVLYSQSVANKTAVAGRHIADIEHVLCVVDETGRDLRRALVELLASSEAFAAVACDLPLDTIPGDRLCEAFAAAQLTRRAAADRARVALERSRDPVAIEARILHPEKQTRIAPYRGSLAER